MLGCGLAPYSKMCVLRVPDEMQIPADAVGQTATSHEQQTGLGCGPGHPPDP